MNTCEDEPYDVLVGCGANINYESRPGHTALMQACSEGRAHIVTAMCKRGALPDFMGKHGRTALIEAARNGHLDVIRALAAGSCHHSFRPKIRVEENYET